MSDSKVNSSEPDATRLVKPKRKVGRPIKDPTRGPQRAIRIPLGYPKDTPEGQAELSRRIKEGQKRANLRRGQMTTPLITN